ERNDLRTGRAVGRYLGPHVQVELCFGNQLDVGVAQRRAANARLWAWRAHWVYPDPAAPEETALRAVARLRDLDVDLDAPGEEKADAVGRRRVGAGGRRDRLGRWGVWCCWPCTAAKRGALPFLAVDPASRWSIGP